MRALLALALLVAGPAWADEKPADPFAGLRFLVGEWTGKGADGSTGTFTFTPDLDGKVLVRKNVNVGPQGARHEDLLVAYPEGPSLKAVYFDNEGHVIHYDVTTAPGRAALETAPAPSGPRFKLVYEQQGEQIAVTFFVAAPSQPYRKYAAGVVERKKK